MTTTVANKAPERAATTRSAPVQPQPSLDHAHRIVIEERIAELWRHRQWWRANRWADWPLERAETTAELRALVRLAREARSLARAATVAAPTWQDRAADYHDWQARG